MRYLAVLITMVSANVFAFTPAQHVLNITSCTQALKDYGLRLGPTPSAQQMARYQWHIDEATSAVRSASAELLQPAQKQIDRSKLRYKLLEVENGFDAGPETRGVSGVDPADKGRDK